MRSALQKAISPRTTLAEQYLNVRRFTEKLCQALAPEDYAIQSMPDASPAKWHLAHTSWFFETFLLKPFLLGYEEVHPAYSRLFNSYYNSAGEMHCRAKRGILSRPGIEDVFRYRTLIDEAMQELFEKVSDPQWEEVVPAAELGIHHEQQHQELLLTDLKHLFSQNPLLPVFQEAKTSVMAFPALQLQWMDFAEGISWIGYEGPEFSFDHEGPRHREWLEPFQLASRLVTNEEYLAFMEDGGYKRPEFWLSDGWRWLQEQQAEAPLYWQKQDAKWFFYTLAGPRPVEKNGPVCHVNYFEADAYARWRGVRLPTEAEWEAASQAVPLEGNFAEDELFHPVPALFVLPKKPAQMFGDVWEWTRSSYAPYPGYHPRRGPLGEYNGKFMCNQYVLRGGSCCTPEQHIRRTYRNFFAPDKRWQFSGIRLARDL